MLLETLNLLRKGPLDSKTEMQKLVFALRHTVNGFLYFTADTAGEQAGVVSELRGHFAAGEIAWLDATACPSEFSFSLLHQLIYDNPDALAYIVYNFQLFAHEGSKQRFYSSLNYTRDLWLRMSKLFLIGMNGSFRTEIAGAAPNFHSIFLTGYNFCSGGGAEAVNGRPAGSRRAAGAARTAGVADAPSAIGAARALVAPGATAAQGAANVPSLADSAHSTHSTYSAYSAHSTGLADSARASGAARALVATGATNTSGVANASGATNASGAANATGVPSAADAPGAEDSAQTPAGVGAAGLGTANLGAAGLGDIGASAPATGAPALAPGRPATRLDSGLEKHSRLSAKSIKSATARFNELTGAVSNDGIQSEWSADAERLYLELLRAWLDCPDISYDWTGLLVADILDRLGDWSRAWAATLRNADKHMIISAVYERLAQYDKALEHCKQAISMRERLLGKDAVDTAEAYSFAATIFSDQGIHANALKWYNKALAVYEKLLGADHPFTATTYNNIALAHSHNGDFQEALDRYKKALSIKERVFGGEHPDTAATYNNIATLYADSEEYSKALEWYGKALSIKERVLGKGHPDTATTYNNIASVYADMGDYIKALDWFQNALDIRVNIFGKEHPKTAAVRLSMEIVRKELDYFYH
jgi:tetratricopeptide (TPR) repeat protein